jgi:hypothetical protein
MGFWPEGSASDMKTRPFYVFFQRDEDEKILANLMNFFLAVSDRWPDAWFRTGRGAVLNKTNGFNALMRFFKKAYLYSTDQPTVVSKDQFLSILKKSSLTDGDFSTERYPPGSSGASKLYQELSETTGL